MMKNRKRYVKAMMKAIAYAQSDNHPYTGTPSRTDGLRVIKRFEKENKIPFDPFDLFHIKMISGKAIYERIFIKSRRIFRDKQ